MQTALNPAPQRRWTRSPTWRARLPGLLWALLLAAPLALSAQITILTEGFEGAFPGGNAWSVGDANPASGIAHWDDKDADFGGEGAHSGGWKGYCAGYGYGGTIPAPTYQNDMVAYMERPIGLAGLTAATLRFWHKLPGIESCCDQARVYVGGTLLWSSASVVTDWTEVVLDLTPFVGATSTLRFEFFADYSRVYEGWYLDDISVSGYHPPANDVCVNAHWLTDGVPHVMDTAGATSTGDPTPTCQGNFGRGVWFKFVAPAGGVVEIRTCGSGFDTVLQVYVDACSPYTGTVACNDDNGALCAGTAASAQFITPLSAIYRVLVGGYNSQSGSLTITAHRWDNLPPTVTCPSPVTVQCLSGVPPRPTTLAQFLAQGGQVSDNFSTNFTYASSDGPLTGGTCGGTIRRTHTVQDEAGNAVSCTQVITVQDTVPPTLTCFPNKTMPLGAAWAFDPPTATDNCGSPSLAVLSTVTNATCGGGYVATRTWQAADVCTNTAVCSQTVTVRETTPPIISGCSNVVITPDPGQCTRSNAGLTFGFTDNCAVAGIVTSPGIDAPDWRYPLGVTPVTITAWDTSGNTNTCSFTVTVVQNELRFTKLPGGAVRLEWSGGSQSTLQGSDTPTGPFVDIPGATSPFTYLHSITGGTFFRLRGGDSSNVVGLINWLLAPGYHLVANQLLAPTNTVAALLDELPDGVTVLPYPFSTGANSRLGDWQNPAMLLTPGTGCFVHNPYPTNLLVRLAGNVFRGHAAIPLQDHAIAINSLVAPRAGRLSTDLGWPIFNHTIYTYTLPTGWQAFACDSALGWLGAEPVVALGQAFVCRHNASSPVTVPLASPFTPWPCGLGTNDWTGFGAYQSSGTSTGTFNGFTFHPSGVYGRVFDADGLTPLASGFSAQFYAGVSAVESNLQPVGPVLSFLTGPRAGYLRAGNIAVPQLPAGALCHLQLRAWETVGGNSFESAAATSAKVGKSGVFAVYLSNDVGLAPAATANEFPVFRVYRVEPLCTAFNALPVGSLITGDAYVGGGVLHLTDEVSGQQGTFLLPAWRPLGCFRATFKALVGDPSSAQAADGFSFCFGSDLASSFGEQGSGSGLIVSFDTWDNGGEGAPCINLKWNGALFAHAPKRLVTGPPARFVDVVIELTPTGLVTVSYDGATVHQAVPIPGYTPVAGDAWFGLGARTGSLNAKHWVDDLCINASGACPPPLLTIARTNAAVRLTWPKADPVWNLHATTNLAPGPSAWTLIAPPYPTNATDRIVTEPTPASHKFYRLHKL